MIEFVCALLAGLIAAIACRGLIAIAPKDAPDGVRKFQTHAVPSAGGVGIFAGGVIALIAAIGFFTLQPSTLLPDALRAGLIPHLILILGCFSLGLADDVLHLPARAKLLILAALCLFAVTAGYRAEAIALPVLGVAGLPPLVSIIGSALWLIVIINAVNFMDGANGLAMGASAMMLLALAALLPASVTEFSGIVPYVRLALIIFAGAIAGFLVWNLRGKIYAGDTGALGIGALIGSASLFWLSAPSSTSGIANGAIWVPALITLPFLIDVLVTLIWRYRRGEDVLSAHRDHAYQVFIRAGWPALRVSALWWAFGIVCGIAASCVRHTPENSAIALGVFTVTGIALWLWQRRVLGARLNRPG